MLGEEIDVQNVGVIMTPRKSINAITKLRHVVRSRGNSDEMPHGPIKGMRWVCEFYIVHVVYCIWCCCLYSNVRNVIK